MFDPWTATFEQAVVEFYRRVAAGADENKAVLPIRQIETVEKVLLLKKAIDGGHGKTVLEAISCCVTYGLVVPEWLADEFNRRYYSVARFDVGSWDDPSAFGRPYPKGTNLAALRKANKGFPAVWRAVNEELERFPETPIDKGLFEKIGEPLGLGATLAEEYYYHEKRIQTWLGLHQPIGRDSTRPPVGDTAKNRKPAGIRKKKR